MKTKPVPMPDELRMKASDFDRIMRGALGVPPPPAETKTKKVTKVAAKVKKKKAR